MLYNLNLVDILIRVESPFPLLDNDSTKEFYIDKAPNSQFDLNFIYQLLCRYYSVSNIDDLFSKCLWLDNLNVFKVRKSFPHRLESMVEYYGVDVGDGFHRAIFDVRALAKCVVALNNERND